ncbi:MAG: 4-hydroxy-tetrahydrodipicolinate reductase [Pseudomonadota bacterium]
MAAIENETERVRIGLFGAAGRMGGAIVREGSAFPGAVISAAYEYAASPNVGKDVGIVAGTEKVNLSILADDALPDPATVDCLLDFSLPGPAATHADQAAAAGIPIVIGATGFSNHDLDRVVGAAEKTLVLRSGNMSLGVNLLARLVERAASALSPADFDIEIVERHHSLKVDSPSGTALLLADAVDEGRQSKSTRVTDSRAGDREQGSVGFSVSRGGGVVGDHSVAFIGAREMLELNHRALDRSLFARGALEASVWACRKWQDSGTPGLFGMGDVIDSLIET